jgi:glycosyltransferase involved in cell wall biosynthesis
MERTVCRVATVLGNLTQTFEVIVTDDGSTDGTSEILARLLSDAPELCLKVISHGLNKGYGAAVASGFDAASYDLLFLMDSDQQFDISELTIMLDAMDDDVDLAIGWRANRADPWLRLLNAWGWKLLVNGLFGYVARDVDCAFKLLRRRVWDELAVRSRGATFSAELLVRAR